MRSPETGDSGVEPQGAMDWRIALAQVLVRAHDYRTVRGWFDAHMRIELSCALRRALEKPSAPHTLRWVSADGERAPISASPVPRPGCLIPEESLEEFEGANYI